ncbi:MAG TPA: peptide ABC transporter substrate-binding protein [Aliidongia sp.]|nr:peptide ABC transporter substrate-binding protein [Aliidongia sp.]
MRPADLLKLAGLAGALILGASMLAALVPAGRSPAIPNTPGRSELVIGMRQAPPSLNPIQGSSGARNYLGGLALRPLSGADKNGRPSCYLCETLPTLENGGARIVDLADGRQGMEVTFTLKPGLSWADGEPVTSRDMVFSWRLARDPEIGAANAETLRHIADVTIVDQRTFTLHLDQIDYGYNRQVTFWVLPAHIEAPILAGLAHRGDYFGRSAYTTDPTNPGLWIGPYRLIGYEPGRSARYERTPAWPGPPAHIPRITVRMIENTAVLEADFLTGTVDYIAGELGLTVDQGLELKARRAYSFDFAMQSSLTYEHVDMNLGNPLLADRRIRRALLLAIDRQTITRRLFDGLLPVADGFVAPGDRGYDPDISKYPYDPAAAGKLLAEAGFLPGPDGVRVDGKERRLAFTLATTTGHRVRELVEQELQAKWRAVGVEITLANDSATALLGDRLPHGAYDLALYAWTNPPEYPPTYMLVSASIPSTANDFSGGNYPRFVDADTDRLNDALVRELDPAKRMPIWARLQEIYARELPALPLFFESTVFVIPTWLKGVDPAGHVGDTTLWVEEWRAD